MIEYIIELLFCQHISRSTMLFSDMKSILQIPERKFRLVSAHRTRSNAYILRLNSGTAEEVQKFFPHNIFSFDGWTFAFCLLA